MQAVLVAEDSRHKAASRIRDQGTTRFRPGRRSAFVYSTLGQKVQKMYDDAIFWRQQTEHQRRQAEMDSEPALARGAAWGVAVRRPETSLKQG